MNTPYTLTEIYGVFSAYNTAVWPIQLLLMALGVLAVVLLIRQRKNASGCFCCLSHHTRSPLPPAHFSMK